MAVAPVRDVSTADHRPVGAPLARNVVPRSRLYARLDAATDVPVFLVCGPAGYGKSLLVSSWVADRRVGDTAWVGLRRSDDTATLWSAISAALATVNDAVAAEREAMTALAPDDVPDRLARCWAAHPTEAVLVLDDLHHVVDPAFHEQLVELVAAGAPGLHLVLVTRHDPPWPLHRMRLDGLVDELRGDALAFDADEATALFGAVGLDVSAEAMAALLVRTQGWAAALRLVAIGASRSPDAEEFVASVSARDEYIADYLLREIFDTLTPTWRTLLDRIRVVDEVSADVALALTNDPDCGEHLQTIARKNALVHEIGHRPGWYRVHPLLLDFLRLRGGTDRSDERMLHRRAASWYRDQGDPMSALKHALAAQEWSLASDLVGTHVVTWTVVRPPRALLALLDEVPDDVVMTHLGLALGVAAGRAMSGSADGVPELLAAVRGRIGTVHGRRRRRAELIASLITWGVQRWRGDLVEVLAACRQTPDDAATLSATGLTDWGSLRTLLAGNAGLCELWLGDEAAADVHLTEAAAQQPGRPLVLPALNALSHLAYLRWCDGELTDAEQLAHRAADHVLAARDTTAVQARCAYLALAGVALDRDDLAAARQWLDRAGVTVTEPHTALATAILTARVSWASGEPFAALDQVRAALTDAQAYPIPARVVDEARRLEEALVGRQAYDRPVAAERTTVRRRLHAHLDDVERACDADDAPAAAEALEHALACAAPGLVRRPFLERRARLRPVLAQIAGTTANPHLVADLLDRMSDDDRARASATLLSPLTQRQLDIVRYLATSLTVKEIADTLYLSVNTLKTHQRAVYQKLGASRRSEAVEHARRLGLL